MIKVKVDNNDLVSKIEALQYEVESRKDLIAFAMTRDDLTDSPSFKQYQEEYRDFFIQYNVAKNLLEKQYVYPKCPNAKRWNLDFETHELTIEE